MRATGCRRELGGAGREDVSTALVSVEELVHSRLELDRKGSPRQPPARAGITQRELDLRPLRVVLPLLVPSLDSPPRRSTGPGKVAVAPQRLAKCFGMLVRHAPWIHALGRQMAEKGPECNLGKTVGDHLLKRLHGLGRRGERLRRGQRIEPQREIEIAFRIAKALPRDAESARSQVAEHLGYCAFRKYHVAGILARYHCLASSQPLPHAAQARQDAGATAVGKVFIGLNPLYNIPHGEMLGLTGLSGHALALLLPFGRKWDEMKCTSRKPIEKWDCIPQQ